MSTRATIKFSDKDTEYFVYRHCDGIPDNVLADIKKCIEISKDRWSEPEVELLVTLFLMVNNNIKERLPDYNITSGFHGDESYSYYVSWSYEKKEWIFGREEKR
jgi:hypothetical protein